MAGVKELRPQLVRGPGTTGHRRRSAGLDQGVGRLPRPLRQLPGDRGRRVGKEIVAGGQRGGRGDAARKRRQVGVDQSVDVGRLFDQAADGEVRQREGVVADGEGNRRAIPVLAQEVAQVQAGLRRAIGVDGWDEVPLVAQACLVGMAEEGDETVIAHDHDVLERVDAPIRVDDALDLQPHQVLGKSAGGDGIGLQVGGLDLVVLPHVHHHARRLRCQGIEVRRHRAQVTGTPSREPARPARIPQDDGVEGAGGARDQARSRPRRQGGDGTHRRAPAGEHGHGQVEGLGEAEDAVAAAHPDIDVSGVVPGVSDDGFARGAVLRRHPDQASRLG